MRSQPQILLLTNSGVQDITCCVQKEVRAHGITEADEKMVKIRFIEYMDNDVAAREAHTLYLTLRSISMSIYLTLESWLRQSMFHLLGPVSVDSAIVSNVWPPCVTTHSNRSRLSQTCTT